MNSASAKHMANVAALGCVLGKRGLHECQGRVEVHHIAEGSGLRSDWAVVGLCEEGHRGVTGIHGLGTKRFCALYRPPGDVEFGLLVWQIELMARTYAHR